MELDDYIVYRDEYGLYKGRLEDPGDSSHRTCSVYYIAALEGSEKISQMHFLYLIKLLECPEWPNNYRRHPSPGWWSEPDRMSRDNGLAIGISLGAMGLHVKLKAFLMEILKRGSFMTNTRRNGATKENHGQFYKRHKGKDYFRDYSFKVPDLFFVDDWSCLLRFFRKSYFYPFWYITDFILFIDALKRRLWPDNDPVNYLLRKSVASKIQPTFWSKLINKVEDKKKIRECLAYYSIRIGFPYDKLFKDLI